MAIIIYIVVPIVVAGIVFLLAQILIMRQVRILQQKLQDWRAEREKADWRLELSYKTEEMAKERLRVITENPMKSGNLEWEMNALRSQLENADVRREEVQQEVLQIEEKILQTKQKITFWQKWLISEKNC